MAEWPYVPVILFFIAAIDFVLLVIPSDLFLIAAILGFEKRRNTFVGAMILGRIAGVLATVALSDLISVETLHMYAVNYHMQLPYEKGQFFFEKFGPLSIGITAVTPFPMMVPAFLSRVAGAPIWEIVFFTLIGSVVRYVILVVSLQACKELYVKYFETSRT
jgi:membrane protein YqaA with SNARE-associated domain